jgi:phosphohistidine phosphatase
MHVNGARIKMLTLMLLRHAKSSWAEAGGADIDRPLNARGQAAASAMGRHIASKGLIPQLVLCSPAKRARDTWKIVAAEFKTIPAIQFDPDIYDFGDGTAIMACLRQKGGTASSIMLVGHSPSIAGLALKLVGRGENRHRERLEQKYPTAALAVINLDLDDWSKLAEGAGTLVDFVRPKEVSDDAT